jgi:hypothetical protein
LTRQHFSGLVASTEFACPNRTSTEESRFRGQIQEFQTPNQSGSKGQSGAERNQMSESTGEKKQLLELHLLDEETKKQVIDCIQKRGKISLSLGQKGTVKVGGAHDGGFTQID